jgi:hypothetical protein
MEIEELLKAKKYLKLADYLLIESYPFLKDSKLLLGTLLNLNQAYENIIFVALSKKTIPLKTPNAQWEQFKTYFKDDLSLEDFESINKIKKLSSKHKNSDVEFTRNQNLIMSQKHYELDILSFDLLKKHLEQAKKIMKKLLS